MKTASLKLSENTLDVLTNIGGGNKSKGVEELVTFYLDKMSLGDADARHMWLTAVVQTYGSFIRQLLTDPSAFPASVKLRVETDLGHAGLTLDDVKLYLEGL